MASQLKLERIRRDLSQTHLAALAMNQVDQPRLSLLEYKVKPHDHEVEIVTEVLGVPATVLWSELVDQMGSEVETA